MTILSTILLCSIYTNECLRSRKKLKKEVAWILSAFSRFFFSFPRHHDFFEEKLSAIWSNVTPFNRKMYIYCIFVLLLLLLLRTLTYYFKNENTLAIIWTNVKSSSKIMNFSDFFLRIPSSSFWCLWFSCKLDPHYCTIPL